MPFLIIFIVLTFTGCKCNNTPNTTLNTPDKIIMYVNGKEKQLKNDSSDYDKTLFTRACFLVYTRLPQKFSLLKGVLGDEDIEEIRGYAVEFVYNKVQTTVIDNRKVYFNEIIFPLCEKWQNAAFIKTTDNFYEGVGIKENLDYLVRASVK